jgi:hypothetical protein
MHRPHLDEGIWIGVLTHAEKDGELLGESSRGGVRVLRLRRGDKWLGGIGEGFGGIRGEQASVNDEGV